jgi:hypothetical protein
MPAEGEVSKRKLGDVEWNDVDPLQAALELVQVSAGAKYVDWAEKMSAAASPREAHGRPSMGLEHQSNVTSETSNYTFYIRGIPTSYYYYTGRDLMFHDSKLVTLCYSSRNRKNQTRCRRSVVGLPKVRGLYFPPSVIREWCHAF